MTFSFSFLHAVTFLHVLHLDVLRGQIEIETESKNLMYGYNAGTPMAIPIYTVLPYRVIVCDSVVRTPAGDHGFESHSRQLSFPLNWLTALR